MIQNLTIKNFKSIKELTIPCKKLNVFIGEPNSGKSNIIEALTLQSRIITNLGLNQSIFRFKTVSDLFNDFDTSKSIEVNLDQKPLKMSFGVRPGGNIDNAFHLEIGNENKAHIEVNHIGSLSNSRWFHDSKILYYNFKPLIDYPRSVHPNLLAPYGENLATFLLTNGTFKKWATDFLKSIGFRLNFKPNENEILFSKIIEDEIYSFPFFMLSETLQRIIFYTLAIESNNDCTILFDEPDTNTFPQYTKELAEMIAEDEVNQFFVTTHNPYLLINLIEKSSKKNINVFITEMKDYLTYIHLLSANQISQVLGLDSDVFFNFERILSI